jgi:hypothetical protein
MGSRVGVWRSWNRVRELTFAEKDVDEGDGAGDQEEGSEAPAEVDRATVPWVTRPLLRLIDKEIKALEATKARIANPPRDEHARPGEDPMVARCSVPETMVITRNLRYERALEREFDRALAELERLQAQRRRTAMQSGSRKDEREGARPVRRTSPGFESDSVERPEPPVGRGDARSSA